jgi:hypothetical protein
MVREPPVISNENTGISPNGRMLQPAVPEPAHAIGRVRGKAEDRNDGDHQDAGEYR